MNTTDVIKSIIRSNPQIEYLYIVEYGAQKDVKKESAVWSVSDDNLYSNALKIRTSLGLPFWQALMLSNINTSTWSKVCLDACIRHNELHHKRISASDFLKSNFAKERIGVSSKIILRSQEIKHIPFIDFHVPATDINTEVVEYICRLLDSSHNGYILNSGNSYHYIGCNLMSDTQMIKFLSMANLFTPITDSAWISHQLFEGSCVLRLGEKNGLLPIVLKKINPNVRKNTSM